MPSRRQPRGATRLQVLVDPVSPDPEPSCRCLPSGRYTCHPYYTDEERHQSWDVVAPVQEPGSPKGEPIIAKPSSISPEQEHNIFATARSKSNLRIALLSGGVGTVLEQFDFAAYGLAAALVFPHVFFPGDSPLAGALKSFIGYAVGFGARPIGGLIFSHLGEKRGRKWVLVSTLAIMGTATTLIGIIPSYATIGIWAPVLLVLMRILQGLGAGAEQSGGSTLLSETAPEGKRGRYSAVVMMGAATGTAFGTFVFSLIQWNLTQDQFLSWGWRIVFIFSIVVTVGAFAIRRKLDESPVFTALQDSVSVLHAQAAPLKTAVTHGWRRILQVLVMNWGPNTGSYVVQTFFVTYVTTQVLLPNGSGEYFGRSTITDIQLIGACIGVFSALMWGALSDKFGRKPVYLLIAGAGVVVIFCCFLLLNTGVTVLVGVAVALGYIFFAYGNSGVQMSYFPELFGARYRYSGVTVAREFSSVIGGGIGPMVCSALLLAFGTWIPLAVYVAITMLCSFLASLWAPETIDRDLTLLTDAVPGEDHSASLSVLPADSQEPGSDLVAPKQNDH